MIVPPPGFRRLERSSPFLDLIGPVYGSPVDDGLRIGLVVEERHCNRRGTVHGGLMATLADIALGYGSGHGTVGRPDLTTASLTIEFLGSARVGDWLEGTTEILRLGSRLGFARCVFRVGESRVVHASGIFSLSPRS